jgi:flagellar basal body-associated protein FliL
MDKKKLIAVLVVVVAAGAYAAYSVAMPKKVTHDRLAGTLYVLPKSFTLNLLDGRYATVSVALELAPGQSAGGATAAAGATLPDGFGGLPEEAAVRDIITNVITNQPGSALINSGGRERIKHQILTAINSGTDVKVLQVLFPDVAVQ